MDRRTIKNTKTVISEPLICNGYQNGMTLKELSNTYKISISTIRDTLLKNNIKLRKRGKQCGQ